MGKGKGEVRDGGQGKVVGEVRGARWLARWARVGKDEVRGGGQGGGWGGGQGREVARQRTRTSRR